MGLDQLRSDGLQPLCAGGARAVRHPLGAVAVERQAAPVGAMLALQPPRSDAAAPELGWSSRWIFDRFRTNVLGNPSSFARSPLPPASWAPLGFADGRAPPPPGRYLWRRRPFASSRPLPSRQADAGLIQINAAEQRRAIFGGCRSGNPRPTPHSIVTWSSPCFRGAGCTGLCSHADEFLVAGSDSETKEKIEVYPTHWREWQARDLGVLVHLSRKVDRR